MSGYAQPAAWVVNKDPCPEVLPGAKLGCVQRCQMGEESKDTGMNHLKEQASPRAVPDSHYANVALGKCDIMRLELD